MSLNQETFWFFFLWGGYRGNLSLRERYSLHISLRPSDSLRYVQTLRFPATSAIGHLLSHPLRKNPLAGTFTPWAATGNRTLIEGSTSLSVNRYTIAAIILLIWEETQNACTYLYRFMT